MLDDSVIDGFVQEQMPKNTRKKTKCDVNIFSRWMAECDEHRDMWDIPPLELNKMLRSFYLCVKKKDGEEYEPDTLSSIHNSIDRYLSEHHYGTSVIRGEEFKTSRDVLQAKRRSLKKDGKGRKPNRSDHLTEEEEQVLWTKGIMGRANPISLQNAVWWRNNFFGIRGRDEHHKMTWGDITIETDVEGRRYLKYMERDTKTRKDPRDERAFAPRIYETPGQPDTCPVQLLLEYTHKRPLEMVQPDAPFYLLPNKYFLSNKSGLWYKCQRMGVHSLGGIMKKMAKDGGLPGRKTNHSGRKTTVKRLREAEIENIDIMQLTGHKNIQGINSYSNVTEEKQRRMSDILVSKDRNIAPPSTSTAILESNADEFSDGLDEDAAVKSLENFERHCATEISGSYETAESGELTLSAQNSLGFSTPLFQSAVISGGTINLTLNINGKGV